MRRPFRLPEELPEDVRVTIQPARKFNTIRERMQRDQELREKVMDAVVHAAVDELQAQGIDISIPELRSIDEVSRHGGEVGIVLSTEGSSKSSTVWV